MPSQDDLQTLWEKLEGRRIGTDMVLIQLVAYLARESGEPDLMASTFFQLAEKDLRRAAPEMPPVALQEALATIADTATATRAMLGLEAMLQVEAHSRN